MLQTISPKQRIKPKKQNQKKDTSETEGKNPKVQYIKQNRMLNINVENKSILKKR